jgi:hypothetical protein
MLPEQPTASDGPPTISNALSRRLFGRRTSSRSPRITRGRSLPQRRTPPLRRLPRAVSFVAQRLQHSAGLPAVHAGLWRSVNSSTPKPIGFLLTAPISSPRCRKRLLPRPRRQASRPTDVTSVPPQPPRKVRWLALASRVSCTARLAHCTPTGSTLVPCPRLVLMLANL